MTNLSSVCNTKAFELEAEIITSLQKISSLLSKSHETIFNAAVNLAHLVKIEPQTCNMGAAFSKDMFPHIKNYDPFAHPKDVMSAARTLKTGKL